MIKLKITTLFLGAVCMQYFKGESDTLFQKRLSMPFVIQSYEMSLRVNNNKFDINVFHFYLIFGIIYSHSQFRNKLANLALNLWHWHHHESPGCLQELIKVQKEANLVNIKISVKMILK